MSGGDRRNADIALIAALAGGATVQEAARQAGTSERTAYRRLEEPEFRQQLAGAKAGLIARAVAMLAKSSSAAALTLAQLLRAESETVRLGAARSILELATKLRETEELAARIDALEQQHAAEGPREGARTWGA